MVRKDLAKYQKLLIANKIGSESELKAYSELNIKDISTDKDWDAAYKIFNHAMEVSYANKSTTEYMKQMSSKYDAMVDDNDQGVYNDAHDPVIIFRAAQNLKDISDPKSPRYLSLDEAKKNYDEVKQHLAKKGVRVRL